MALLFAGLSCSIDFSASAQNSAQREANAPEQVKRQLREIRQEIQTKKLNYTVGYTIALDKKLVTGATDPSYITPEIRREINTRAVRNLELNKAAKEKYLREHPEMSGQLPELILKRCDPRSRRFNWQDYGIVTPAKNQYTCTARNPDGTCPINATFPHPTCWAFAATAAFESSYKIINGESIDASEQYVINGVVGSIDPEAAKCNEGQVSEAMQYYQDNGGVKEAALPYTCDPQRVNATSLSPTFRASAWGFVQATGGNAARCPEIPTDQDIKRALCEHGPITALMCFNSQEPKSLGAFCAHKAGVYYEDFAPCNCYKGLVHAVVIVGWDDFLGSSKDPEDPYQKWGAWRVKNSYPDWGEQGHGFGWISYASNRIGSYAAWVLAESKKYPRATHPSLPVPGQHVLPPPHLIITDPAGPR